MSFEGWWEENYSHHNWYGYSDDCLDIDVYDVKCVAENSWNEQQERILATIERLENYPCCMSCYVTQKEMSAARDMKDNLIRILKEELLC